MSKPLTVDDVAEMLDDLAGGFGQNINSKKIAKSYLGALLKEQVSFFPLKKAVEDILTGSAGEMSLDFFPSAPRLATYCKSVMLATIGSIKHYEKILTAKEARAPVTLTLERMAEIEAEMKKAGAQ